MRKNTVKKVLLEWIVALCIVAVASGAALSAFYGGLINADFRKGACFNMQGVKEYAFTRKANFTVSNISANPIYPVKLMEKSDYSVKDACIVEDSGKLFLFASAFYEENGRLFPHIIGAQGDRLTNLLPPFMSWSGSDSGFLGLASPDVAKHGDFYFMVYNSWGDKKGEPNRLFYSKSTDLENWDTPRPLAENLTNGVRAIDAAVMFYNSKVYLVYKREQKIAFAAADSIDGDFKEIENKVYGWYENCQFLNVNNEIYLLGTNRRHLPVLLKMQGDPKDDASWGNFKPYLALTPPKQGFNTDNVANAASIFTLDGEYYLLYAGRTEGRSHIGRGNNKLGVAKSRDLINWTVL